MELKKIVIGVTGTLGSGKGVIGKILKDQGCHCVDLGDVVRDEVRKTGQEVTRKNQQDMGNKLRKEVGGHALVKIALDKYKSYDVPLVITGLRNLDEVNYLKEHTKFSLIGVDAPFETRWERIKSRNRDADLLNHDKFVIDDARDRGFNEPLNGQQVAMCLVHADFLINNDEEFSGPVEQSKIYRQVIEIFKKIKK
jgi:dephospho-CoA kinase